MKKLISTIAAGLLVFTLASETMAIGSTSGARVSTPSVRVSTPSPKVSTPAPKASTSTVKSFGSSSKSSGTSKSTKSSKSTSSIKSSKPKSSSSVKTKPVTQKKLPSGNVQTFTPPSSQVNGVQYHNRDVFLTTYGTYTVYNAINDDVDCDYDDIMEGDSDCDEVTLTDSQVKSLGLDVDDDNQVQEDSDNDEESDGGMLFLGILVGILSTIIIGAIILLITRAI